MKHTIVIYRAPKIENAILSCFEGDNVKIFCKTEEITFSTSSNVTEEKFKEVMKRSKEAFEKGEEDYWIAAVSYMENLFKENESSILVV